MKEVRIGFIGCGGNANGHMNTLSSLEETRIVSFCDLQEEGAQNAAERHQAVAYTDHRGLASRSLRK